MDVEVPLLSAFPVVAGRMGGAVTSQLDLLPIDERSTGLLAPIFAKPKVWKFPYS